MGNLLYLVHRLPYPPNKGDKVRSYHLLEHLRARHRVFLGTFVDDPEDEQHVDTLRAKCADVFAQRLDTRTAKVKSLAGLLTGEPLTLRYYRSAEMRRWVQQTVQRERIDAVVVFSSSMAQYAEGLNLPKLVDFVDVDSAKWAQRATQSRWPESWLFRREGERLLHYERSVAARAARAFFVTDKESALFRSLAPESERTCETVGNGVDAEYFSPDAARASPFSPGELPIVFTGAMDYWPNIDAAQWFAAEMLPELRRRWPALRFHVVGRAPAPAVRQLAGEGVAVSGTVPDVRPYLQHAALVVAPLRLARGIQNKVLEAMAMGRPVVAASECAEAVGAQEGRELLTAADPSEFIHTIDTLLRDAPAARRIGEAGRHFVQRAYSWPAQLAAFERHLPQPRLAVPA